MSFAKSFRNENQTPSPSLEGTAGSFQHVICCIKTKAQKIFFSPISKKRLWHCHCWFIPIPSATDRAREKIPKQPGCQTVAQALLHLAWKVLQKAAETAAEQTRSHSPSRGGSSLISFTWKLAVLLVKGLLSHNLTCFLIKNLLAPQLQKPSVLGEEESTFPGLVGGPSPSQGHICEKLLRQSPLPAHTTLLHILKRRLQGKHTRNSL